MSNTITRILIGIIGIPLIILLSYLGGIWFLAFCLIVSSLCLWEFFSLFEKSSVFPLKTLALIISAFILILFFIMGPQSLYCFLPVIILTSAVEFFRKIKMNPGNVIVACFGYLYITLPFIFLNEMNKNYHLVLYLFILIWASDTLGFFGGKFFGRHRLTTISPKKTVEGSIIAFSSTVLVSLAFSLLVKNFISIGDAVIVGVLTGIASQLGDIFESLLKRTNDIKDSSKIIPGHGGVLDRFDSLLFVIPVVYAYFNFFRNLN